MRFANACFVDSDCIPFPLAVTPASPTPLPPPLGLVDVLAVLDTAPALHRTALHCTALHCTAPHCTALHRTALHCTAPHCTALHRGAATWHCNMALQHGTALHLVSATC